MRGDSNFFSLLLDPGIRAPSRIGEDPSDDDMGGLWANVRRDSGQRAIGASRDDSDGDSLEAMIRAAWRCDEEGSLAPDRSKAAGRVRGRPEALNRREAMGFDLPGMDLDPGPAALGLSREDHEDEWYIERRVQCAVCRRNVEGSKGAKEGIRCGGCRR